MNDLDDLRLSFIVAGVQKCGTTALFTYLSRQETLQAPQRKELHFFDDDQRNWRDPDYRALHAAFADEKRGLRFEATPVTLYWPHALERAKRYNDGLKLILLFRDPVARAYSHWRMERARGLETADFGWCIRNGRARVGAQHRIFSYVERGFYGAQLARARSLFDRDHILCLSTPALRREPDLVLQRIFRFLDISAVPDPVIPGVIRPESEGIAAVPSEPEPYDLRYLRDLYAEDTAAFTAMSRLPERDFFELI